MKIIKKLNNNAAIGIDDNKREVIVFGKGVGFEKIPYELTDLSRIDRTYYGIDNQYLGLIGEIPEVIFDLSNKIVDYALLKTDKEFNPNIVFTLADHIHFAVQRFGKNMNFKFPISNDIKCLYEEETRIGQAGIHLINKKLNIHLTEDEAVGIALHFINAENTMRTIKSQIDKDKIIDDIVEIIEKDFSMEIDQKGFNYSRFISHMHYLLKRRNNKQVVSSENIILFESMKQKCDKTYRCVYHIKDYLQEVLKWDLNQEELLYLMLHINRLCTREDCNQ